MRHRTCWHALRCPLQRSCVAQEGGEFPLFEALFERYTDMGEPLRTLVFSFAGEACAEASSQPSASCRSRSTARAAPSASFTTVRGDKCGHQLTLTQRAVMRGLEYAGLRPFSQQPNRARPLAGAL